MIRSFWRDSVVYTAGTLVTRGLGLLLLPLYTRVLSPAQFGVLELVITAGVLVNLVVPMETSQAMARLWNERPPGSARRALAGTGLTFALVAYAIFALLAWVFDAALVGALNDPAAEVAMVHAGAAFIACNGLLLTLQGQFRSALRPRSFAFASVSYAALVLVGMGLFVGQDGVGVARVLWLQAAAAALVAAACLLSLRDEVAWGIDRSELGRMLDYSLPLVPAGLAMFATVNAHRFMLGWLGSLEQVGLFGLASRVASVATLVLIGVQTSLTPLIYAHHEDPVMPVKLARLFEFFWSASLLVCLALNAFAAELMALVGRPAYAEAAGLLVWLAPAALLSQMYMFAPGISLAKKSGHQLALTGASATAGLALSAVLIPHFQAAGAAAATCVAAGLFLAGWWWIGQALYPLPVRAGRLSGVTLAYVGLSVAMACTSGEGGQRTPWWIGTGSMVLLLALVVMAGLLDVRLLARPRTEPGRV